MMVKYKSIVVKVGTHVLTGDDGYLDKRVLKKVVEEICALKKAGIKVILVSSGAMGAGRALLLDKMGTGVQINVSARQIFAAVGQARLMNHYTALFARRGYFCGQVLATKEDFRDRRHFANMKNCFDELLRQDIVPIVNENDAVAIRELMFTDNDELAGLVGAMMDVDALAILTDVDGVLDRQGKVIPQIVSGAPFPVNLNSRRSAFGRGGMVTKCKVARRLAALGIPTYIADGRAPGILLQIASGQSVGTFFPAERKVSRLKRWIAHGQGMEKGVIYINRGAFQALRKTRAAASILPVGVVKVEGDFEKGDLIKVRLERGKDVGLGLANYNAVTARKYLGKRGMREIIHYDYLYLFT